LIDTSDTSVVTWAANSYTAVVSICEGTCGSTLGDSKTYSTKKQLFVVTK